MQINKTCPHCLSTETIISKTVTLVDGTKKQQRKCKNCKSYYTVNLHQENTFRNIKDIEEIFSDDGYYFITSAQNDTKVDQMALKTIKAMCDHLNAEIIVIPFTYSKAGIVDHKLDPTWDKSITPYIKSKRTLLGDSLEILCDVKIMATTMYPLSGLEAFTADNDAILGHMKQHLTSSGTLHNGAKIMYSTGAITKDDNLSKTGAGIKAKFNHILGGLLVEIRDGKHTIRQINVDSRYMIYDLTGIYNSTGFVQNYDIVDTLVLGDTHHAFIDNDVNEFNMEFIQTHRPDNVICHDVIDFYHRNHHNRKDPFYPIGLMHSEIKNSIRSVKDEVLDAVKYIDSFPANLNVYIVNSNHDNAFSKWIKETNWKDDPVNAEFYLETALHMVKNTVPTINGISIPDAFKFWVEKLSNHPRLNVLSRRDSKIIHDIECAMHGDRGVNGSRGNIRQFAKLPEKTITGHSHSPSIINGAFQVGTNSLLKMDYSDNGGPSSWAHCNCVIYKNGKRSLIFI